MFAFGFKLPAIRRRVERDLRRRGLPRTKVLAAIIALLERTLIRVGNEEYTEQNGSYGLTTLRNHHVLSPHMPGPPPPPPWTCLATIANLVSRRADGRIR